MYIDRPPASAQGVSLIELVVFITVVSVAVIGVLAVMNLTSLHSADPMARKQAVIVAESLLEEIETQAFTLCDSSDTNAGTGSTTGCVDPFNDQRVLGPTSGQTRSSALTPFENVGDYAGFAMPNGITSLSGAPISRLAGYNARVTIINAAGPGLEFPALPAGTALRITVDVSGAASASLTGYRLRYAPDATP